jgi:myo-inositol catabolism protein IolC
MTLGYTSPLYLLAFDHRHSYVTGMFQFTTPLTADEHNVVAESQRVIDDGFRQALTADQRVMFELLVPVTTAQLDRAEGNTQNFDRQIRPGLMLQTTRALKDAGVEPDIWKIEGLARREDCERVVDMARRDGRGHVSCIVLGRGADDTTVVSWLETAASVPGFIGFAVGRTTFWDAVADYEARRVTRHEAVSRVAHRYREWASIFERTQPLPQGRA